MTSCIIMLAVSHLSNDNVFLMLPYYFSNKPCCTFAA